MLAEREIIEELYSARSTMDATRRKFEQWLKDNGFVRTFSPPGHFVDQYDAAQTPLKGIMHTTKFQLNHQRTMQKLLFDRKTRLQKEGLNVVG